MLYLYAAPQTLKVWSLLPFENLIHLEVNIEDDDKSKCMDETGGSSD